MEPQRYLRCLGQPALFTATGEPIRFRTRKHLALLVYLAVEQRTQRRDRVAELLWPRVSANEARHSLATALSVLRPRVGIDALETSRDQVRLIPGRVTLDLERLRAGDILGTEVTGPLEVAAFLDGFDINDSAEFTHWKDQQQARLLPIIKDAMLVLIDRCRRTGDSRQIEQVADRMLALDELSEEAIRAKMEARAFAGDRLTALEIFEAWKKKLAEELQAVPSDMVEGIAVRLRRRGWERTTLANIPNVPTDQWRDRLFIGRNTEYQMLYEMWEATRSGSPKHALILGDSGVGKTTLVQRLTTAAGLQGAAISRVQCYDVEREIPYSTLSGLITGLLDQPGVSATSPEALGELSRTVPQVRQRFPHLPPINDSQGETARIRLTEAFLEMLISISEEHPIILVVDDLHLADDVSLAVLHLMMRRSQGRPIMMTFLARPGELSESPQAILLRESALALGIAEIEVSSLGTEETRQILASLMQPLERQPGIAEQRALLRASAGYPMVLELLVQEWQRAGEQSLALAVDAMTADVGVAESSKKTYGHILHRITKSLNSTTHSVLNVAALLGPRLNDIEMYGIVDLTAGQTMTALAELVSRRVLRDGMQGLEFVNELIRGATYIRVPQSLRHLLHSKIADLLITRASHGAEGVGLEIAWHCMRAARPKEATGFLLRGARESLSLGAVHSAERALSSALPYLEAAENQEAKLLLAETLQEQGRWSDSLAVLDQAAADEYSDIAVLLRIIATQNRSYPGTERLLIDTAQVCKIIEKADDLRVQVKGANALATITSHSKSQSQAKYLLARISGIPLERLNDDELSSLADSKARLYYYAYQTDSCLEEIHMIESRLRNRRYVNTTMGSLHTGLGAVACCRGNYAEARNKFRDAYDIATRLGNDDARATRAIQVALCSLRLGEYDEAIHWSLVATENAGSRFRGYLDCQCAMYLSWSHALQNRHQQACEAVSWMDARLPVNIPAWLKQRWLLAKADALLLLGQFRDAVEIGMEAIGKPQPVLHSVFQGGPFARWLALSARGTSAEPAALEKLQHMTRRLDSFDALDQLEIVCAEHLLRTYCPATLEGSTPSFHERLKHLPHAVSQQLMRLGLLAS